jgi:hypothetical protein
MFGMNDEVVHTGYGPMCHYLLRKLALVNGFIRSGSAPAGGELWMVGVGPSKYLAASCPVHALPAYISPRRRAAWRENQLSAMEMASKHAQFRHASG